MGFRNGAYAKVWKVENKGKYAVAEMSTSKKIKDTDDYETDWSNKFVRLVGTAAKQAESLQDGARVKIGECDVTNNYDKEKKIMYTNYVIFNFHEEDTGKNSPNHVSANSKPVDKPTTMEEDDDLPF